MRLLRESDSLEKNNLTAQEWNKFYMELKAELPRARSGAPWVRKFGYDVAYARPYTHFM